MKIIFILLLTALSLLAAPIKIAFQDRVVDALFIIALEQKLFEKEGLEIEAKRFTNGNATSEALIFGDADFATMGDTAALLALDKYCPNIKLFTPLGGGEKRHSIVVSKESTLQSLKDLEGKKIGIKKGTSTHGGFLLKTSKEGVMLEKNLIDLDPSLMASALMTKELDAIVASEPTPSILVEKGVGKRVAYLDGVGNSYPLLLMAKERSLRNHAEALPKLIRALRHAATFIKNEPDQSAQRVANVSGLSLKAAKESMAHHSYAVGFDPLSQESLVMMERFLRESGKLKQTRSLDVCSFKE